MMKKTQRLRSGKTLLLGWASMLLALGLACASGKALAWVYPEHRELSLQAVQGLDKEHRQIFDRLWQDARQGDEQRLCAQGADSGQGLAPACIDWAALAAIGGDHSCSSQEMFETARASNWILAVADVAAQLKVDLVRIPVTAPPEASLDASALLSDAQRRFASESARAERINALRTADIRLQRADPEYATRAGANNAHFLLARSSPVVRPKDYAALTLQEGAEINAVGVYFFFHLSALQKAGRLAREQLDPAQRQALARAAMADEAFALHFLQDVFAAGHVAGSWGNTSQRKGTHDFYNQNGLEVFTWKGGSSSVVLMGDAHLRPEDARVVAATVRESLEQLLDVAAGREQPELPPSPGAPAAPDPFDVCLSQTLPARTPQLRPLPEHSPYFVATLETTPVPGLGPGLGAMPRFRSEVGPFIGLAGSIDGRGVDGGFAASQTARGAMGGLDLSVRAGVGLDGVMGEAGDGLVFASIGLRADTPSTNHFSNSLGGSYGGNLSAAIPARSGYSFRFRMPYYLLPGDLLLAAPLYLVNPKAYSNMAVSAGNGGLLGLQAGWATGIGRFQFVLGRELGITLYGRDGKDQMIAPADGAGPARIVRFRSTSYDLPIIEYRPFRAFSTNQGSSVLVQLFAAADVPHGGGSDFPAGAPPVSLHTVWSVGLRLVFDWRYYY